MSDDLDLDLNEGSEESKQQPKENNPPVKKEEQKQSEKEAALLAEVAKLKKQLEKKETPKEDINSIVAAEVAKALKAMKADMPSQADANAIAEDDVDEDGKYYFSYRYATALTGYMFGGKMCDNPMAEIDSETNKRKAIVFLYMGHKTTKVGGDIREAESIVLCHYCSRSKAEQAWIENHPEFKGGIIFTDVRRATGASALQASRAAIAARILNSVNIMPPTQVAAKAKQYGIPVTTDVDAMKVQIVDFLVEAEIEQAKGLSQRIAKDASREGLFQTGDEGSFSTRKTHANA